MKKATFLIVFSLTTLWLAAQASDWLWAKQAGGTDYDWGSSVATDSSGNCYLTGSFRHTATFGTITLISTGDHNLFIAKLDSDGNWLWAKQAGGESYDNGLGIATDDSGNCYVTGYFKYTATFGSITLTSWGSYDIFVAKLDPNGNWLWVKQAGGISDEHGLDIATDSSGNNYVTGYFKYIATFGYTTLTCNGDRDIFVAKLDTNGNWLWAKQAGGTSWDDGECGYGIATDSDGQSYVTGVFSGTASFGSTIITNSGGFDIFVAKLDTNGNWLWATQAGGIYDEICYGIATDSSGNSYVTGVFSVNATFGSTLITSCGGWDIFVAKLDTNGNWLWARQAGGVSDDRGYEIATYNNGNSYVTGYFYDTATFGSTYLTSSVFGDIFIAKLDTNGNWLWASQAGGTGNDHGNSITIDSSGSSYLTGFFSETATFDNTTITSSGSWDIFVAKLSSSTGLSDEYGVPQANFSLGQNHPNPFTASTSFYLEVSDAKSVYEVSVYDLRGRHICTLHQGVLPAGKRTFTWNGKDDADNELASGVYFYRVSNGISSQVKKMIHIR